MRGDDIPVSPDWLEAGEVLDEEAHRDLVESLLEDVENHLNPALARSMRALGEEFVEWRARGVYLYDPLGRAWFDAAGAGGVFGLGHGHPRVVEAVRRQLERGGLSCRAGLVPGQARLARLLARKAPGDLRYVYLGSSGTEAVEAALKLARLATGRPGLVGTRFGYHGMSIAALSVSGIPFWREGFPPLLPGCRLVPFGDLEALDRTVDDETAAVILEPVQWASGCTPAPEGYLEGARRLCRERGALLILDEIQTGLGRTGRWFACEHFGVEPDLLCLGKVLSGGVVPISATLYGERVQAAAGSRPLFNNSTFGGSPLACAAAVAACQALEEEGLVERAAALGARLAVRLEALLRKFPDLLEEHRGMGLMRTLFTRDPRYGIMTAGILMEEHRVLLPSLAHAPMLLRISPPFTTTDEEFDELLEALEAALSRVRALGTAGIDRYLYEVARKVQAGQGSARSPAKASEERRRGWRSPSA